MARDYSHDRSELHLIYRMMRQGKPGCIPQGSTYCQVQPDMGYSDPGACGCLRRGRWRESFWILTGTAAGAEECLDPGPSGRSRDKQATQGRNCQHHKPA